MKLLIKCAVIGLVIYGLYKAVQWMIETLAGLPLEDTTKYSALYVGTFLALMAAHERNCKHSNLERLIMGVAGIVVLVALAINVSLAIAGMAAVIIVVVNVLASVFQHSVREKIWDWLFPVPGTETIPLDHP